MKRILLLSLSFVTTTLFAQGIKLETGKKITTSTSTTMDMDMGMAGKMKILGTTTNLIEITGADDKNYKATNTITKMLISQDGMGQTVSFDSDKKADRESEVGKGMSGMLDVAAKVTIDKNTGKVTEIDKKIIEPTDSNPMASLMGSGAANTAEGTTAAAFFYIPKDKKIGDVWSDSVNEAGMKGIKNFELKSIDDKSATIAIKTKSKGTISKEIQGMQMDIAMDGTGEGIIIVDTKTSLVKKSTANNDVSGTLDMMGQSIPLTLKMTSKTEFK